MESQIPDFNWYSGISRKHKLPPRCPLATSDKCPRYYASLWLLGKAGITTKITDEDRARLDEKWSAFKDVVSEEEAGISHSDGQFSSVSNFCPEVSQRVFGIFASGIYRYADELDRDLAHRRLGATGAPSDDPGWNWAAVTPAHYTECREYSVLSEPQRERKVTSKRVGLSPGIRWQVFARDSFTCQYCGKKPPEVTIEVDHKTSVDQGGSDEVHNLITACLKCNRGKGPRSLT